MSYLKEFYLEALKNKKVKLNSELKTEEKVGVNESGNLDFYGEFTSLMRPELKDKLADFASKQQQSRNKILDEGLNRGMSYEDIAAQSGIATSTIQSYADQTRPGYGVKPTDNRNPLSRAWDTINTADSGRSLTTATPSAEAAQKSAFQQTKEFGTSLFTGVEKVGDAIEALPNISLTTPFKGTESIAESRLKHWDEERKAGRLSREEYQKLLEQQLKDTEWAGTEDKGTGDRLKTAAGVSLEATSEIVPFLKAGQIAQLTTKGGAAFGGLTGLAHGTGQELNNPEGFDWKNVGLQTAIGTGAGAVFGKFAQNSAEAKQFLRDFNTRRVLATIDGLPDEVVPITDTSRLLSAHTQSTKTNLTTRLGEIDSQLNDIRSGKAVNTTYEPTTPSMNNLGTEPTSTTTPRTTAAGTPDMRTSAAKQQGVVTPSKTTPVPTKASQIRGLVKERQQLLQQLDAVESGSGPLERVAQINDELSEGISKGTLDPDQTANLLSEKQTIIQSVKANPSPIAQQNAAYIEEQANIALKNQALVDPSLPSPQGKVKTPRASQRLADEYGFTTTAQINELQDTVQDSVYFQLKESNPELIDKIVKGEVDARQFGALTNEHVVKREAQAAGKAGNYQALKEMADGKVLTEASLKGQETSSLRDLISPVRVMKKVIDARKAAVKSGAKIPKTISDFEAEQILSKTTRLERLYDKVMAEAADGNMSLKTRLEYGRAKVDLDKYTYDLMPGKTIKDWVKNPFGAAVELAGTSKSLRATLDVSGILRQGAKLLASGHYNIWARNTLKSLRTAVKSFGDENVMDAVNAEIISRPNYLNGLYKKMGIPLYDVIEEAFPSKALGKVPFLNKLYGASDAAYTSFMQLNRADLADMYIKKALKAGVDLDVEGKAIGSFVNSLSSRASLGKLEGSAANAINNIFFSPRLMKSNFDVLGGHVISGGAGTKMFTKEGSNFVRRHAAMNLIKIAATTYGILKLADAVRPNSVEWDPRSSNYGKIKIGNTRFDVTGGMSSLVTLGSRLATGSSKSSTTDIVSELDDPDNPRSQSTLSVIGSFGENKLSPAVSALQDIVAKEDFTGKKPTVGSTLRNLTMPIVVDNYGELSKDPNAAPLVASMILEGLGVSTNTYDSTDDWQVKPTAAQKGFKQAVGDTKFKVANDLYNKRYTDWFREIRYSDQYKKMDSDSRRKLISNAGDDLEKQIMSQFGYTYKKPKTEDPNQGLIDTLNIFNK